MPKSRTRKGHKSRVAKRNKIKKDRANQVNKLFADFSAKIKDAPDTVVDLLNKEEELKTVVTTASTGLDEDEYHMIDLPEQDPNEPIIISTPGISFTASEEPENE